MTDVSALITNFRETWKPIEFTKDFEGDLARLISAMRGEVVALCEDTEETYASVAASDTVGVQGAFARGRITEAKSIRKAICEVFR